MSRHFEQRQESDPIADAEARRLGRLGPLPDEIRRERSNAEARGEDPNDAEKRFRATFKPANKKLRMKQGEEAVKELEGAFDDAFRGEE